MLKKEHLLPQFRVKENKKIQIKKIINIVVIHYRYFHYVIIVQISINFVNGFNWYIHISEVINYNKRIISKWIPKHGYIYILK